MGSGSVCQRVAIAPVSGRRTTLLSFPAGAPVFYDMTAQGQAIWAEPGPVQAGHAAHWTIWRWSGGAPAEITALPPYYGAGGIALCGFGSGHLG